MPIASSNLYLITSFFCGALPFGWIIAKLWGVDDLRKVGSTNVGATNVVRTAGILPGALTFLLDFIKGLLPLIYFPEATIWFGVAAVSGHCFSPFLSFRGGKGVSTALGVLVAYNPFLGAAVILTYLAALAVTRVSALGSLFAMVAALTGALLFAPQTSDKIGIALIVCLVLSRHKQNWDKLLHTFIFLFFCLSTQLNAAQTPKRIVALMPSLAETVNEFGLGHALVGAPDYSRLPDQMRKKILNLGPYNRITAEAVFSTHPDLVLASMDGNEASVVKQLESLGLRVVTVDTRSISDILRSMELIAQALGNSKTSQLKLKEIRAAFLPEKNSIQTKSKRVFVQIGWNPLVTISGSTFIGELVALAKGGNIFQGAPTKYPRPNPEEVIALDPEIIIICKLTDQGTEAEEAMKFWKRFKNLTAVKSDKIYVIPGDWLTKPGFPLLNGLRELKKIL